MQGLRLYLSPFAPDTAGAAAVFFGMDGLVVIVDAGGCAGNIAGFDEPRWERGRSAVFSAGLRDMDAIMGRDDRLVEKLRLAAADITAPFIALVGTPVPAVIGTDFRALSRLGKKATGLPVVTADCDGTRLYDAGAAKAWLSLFKEFAKPAAGNNEGKESNAPCRGLLGVSPLDFTPAEAAQLLKLSQGTTLLYGAAWPDAAAGSTGQSGPALYTGLDAIRRAAIATENIVVSAQGLKAARWLKDRFGTPYRIDSLLADYDWQQLSQRHSFSGKEKILLLHESVRALSLQKKMQSELPNAAISTAGWFMPADELGTPDARLQEEDEFAAFIQRLAPDIIIADRALTRALPDYQGTVIDWPHYAVSGAR